MTVTKYLDAESARHTATIPQWVSINQSSVEVNHPILREG